jgi:molybdopterin converting factor small subunit
MMKRLTWFLGGAAAGIAGASVAKKKVKAAAAELAPSNIARKTVDRVRDAMHEGKRSMRAKEQELRARLDGRADTLADELAEGDTVLVDGQPVEPGQVIVLRQVRERNEAAARRRRA